MDYRKLSDGVETLANACPDTHSAIKERLLIYASEIKYLGEMREQFTKRADDAEVRCKLLEQQLNRAIADNKRLCAAMAQIRCTEIPGRTSVIYELEYNSALPHDSVRDIALIIFKGLMAADLIKRNKEE